MFTVDCLSKLAEALNQLLCQDWDKDWAERIKLEKFRWHNSQWLEMVENTALDSTGFDKASTLDNDLPAYLEDDIMQHTLLFPSGVLSYDRSIPFVNKLSPPMRPDLHLALNEPDDMMLGNDFDSNKDIGNRPKSRYSRDLDSDLGDSDPLFNKSCMSTSNSSEDLVRNGLSNLMLGPLLPADDSQLDAPQYSCAFDHAAIEEGLQIRDSK
ncbi:unnamed protein product, partial [Timema podura]|nr:unnamed protein product [Timema podura]